MVGAMMPAWEWSAAASTAAGPGARQPAATGAAAPVPLAWLRKHLEQADVDLLRELVAVMAECYVRGVSTRRVEGLVQTLGIEASPSDRSPSSPRAWKPSWPRSAEGQWTPALLSLSVDALSQRGREAGRIVNLAMVIATGVSADGHREVLGVDARDMGET